MEWVKLCDVAEVIMGQSPKSEYCNDNKEGLPFYQGVSDFGEIFPVPTKYCTEPKKIAEIDDILIGVRAPVGDLNISNSNCCIGRGVAAIRANEKFISKKYLFYFLKTQKQYFEINSTGSTFKAINKSVLSETLVPIIDINKQKIIEDMLDRIENIIRKRKEQIQAYDDLIESLFLSSIDNSKYELIKINDLILEKPKRLSKDNTSSISYFDISSIDNLKNVIKEEKIITEVSDRPGRAKQILEKNDILLSNVRPNLKNIAYFDFNNTCLAIGSTGFTILRSDIKRINPRFLFYSVLTEEFTEKLLINSTGASYPAVKEEIVRDQTIKVPPIELQNKFADYVIKIEEEKKKLNSSLKELEDLFDALMQEAFSGNLFKD